MGKDFSPPQLLVYSSKALINRGYTGAIDGTENAILVSHIGGKNSITSTITIAPQGAHY